MKIVSGGQTGVDRAALDAAQRLGLEIGGWCPKGRWAEDGKIPERYPLAETRSSDVHVRTQRNVETSSATLVICRGSPIGGARYTVELAESIRRPLLIVDLTLARGEPRETIARWIDRIQPEVLNVAGPRESGAPGITEEATRLLFEAFERSRHVQAGLGRPMRGAAPESERAARSSVEKRRSIFSSLLARSSSAAQPRASRRAPRDP